MKHEPEKQTELEGAQSWALAQSLAHRRLAHTSSMSTTSGQAHNVDASGWGSAPTEDTRIADLKPGMKNLNCTFIVLQRGATTKTKEGNTIIQYLVADSSGSIQASFWDEKAEALQLGDIFRLRGAYVLPPILPLHCNLFRF